MHDETLLEKARNIRLLLMDCDGVLTDGKLYFGPSGEAMKAFHVRDGQGIVEWHKAGLISGIISGRRSEGIVEARANELGIQYVVTSSNDKTADIERILAESGVAAEHTAFIGDDIGDIGLMQLIGLPVAVADAVDGVKAAASYTTKANGGDAAVREVIDILLAARIG
ncbi:MAG: HAD hydrolase family protein [Acidobacteria bacterium]|nr:HAD hydrolase family protein [Acidobacteriota bacterium]